MTTISQTQTVRFNRQQHAREWKRLHHSLEQQAYPVIKRGLDSQTQMVVDFIKSHGVSNLSSHLSVLVSKQPIQVAYEAMYRKSGVAGATFAYDKINEYAKRASKKDAPGFFSEQWRKLMSLFYHTQAAERVQGVTDTTKEHIQRLLDDSQDMPISQQATYMVAQLDDPEFNRMRALRIARTETTASANYGAYLGGESSDYEVAKQWVAIEDQNTRPDHRDADGQLVNMDDAFVVGGYQMLFPGDLSAPASECVNCRCCMAVVPLLSDSGLPILKIK